MRQILSSIMQPSVSNYLPTDMTRFKNVVVQYQTQVRDKLVSKKALFVAQFVSEFLPRWKKAPPDYMTRWGNTPGPENLKAELQKRAEEVFDQMLAFEPPEVHLVEKNISPKNVADPKFLEPLRAIMERRHVPSHIINTLFETGETVPESGRLL